MPETCKTQSIVLKSIPYSETSSIVRIYTRESGLISCLVRGCRKKSSKLGQNVFQNLAIIDIVTGKHKSSDLFYITEVCPLYTYSSINNYPANFTKNCIFLFINEFLVKCLKEGVHSEELFDFIYQSLITLDSVKEISPDYHIIFIIHLASLIGFAFPNPLNSGYNFYDIQNNKWTTEAPPHSYYIPSPYINDILAAMKLTVNERIVGCNNGSRRKVIVEYIIKYYQFHIPEIGKIQSLEILSTIQNS